jgi:hypothetical protein
MKYKMPLLLLFLVNTLIGFSTAQLPDQLIIKGKTYAIFSNPLEKYFEINTDARPKFGAGLTSLHRGYVAGFEIKNDKLVLKQVMVPVFDEEILEMKWVNVIDSIFPEHKERELNWYSGVLVIPTGKMKKYVHGWYASTYKKYKIIEITNGIQTNKIDFKLKHFLEFKEESYLKFKDSSEYDKVYNEIKTRLPNYSDETIESLIKERITDYIKKIE